MHLDFAALPAHEAYRWLTATVTPRPIAWVSTRAADGIDNLAPFSFFQVVCDAPPTLMLVSAFAGKDRVFAAYAHAVRERYRFFSYGDAMLLFPSAASTPAEPAHAP